MMKKVLLLIIMMQCTLVICAQTNLSDVEKLKKEYSAYDKDVEEIKKLKKRPDWELIAKLQDSAIVKRTQLIGKLEQQLEDCKKKLQISDFFAILDSSVFTNITLEEMRLLSELNEKEKIEYEKIVAIRSFIQHTDSIQEKIKRHKEIAEEKYDKPEIVYEVVRTEVKQDIYTANSELIKVYEMLTDPQTGKIETSKSGLFSAQQYEYLKKYQSKFEELYKKWILKIK